MQQNNSHPLMKLHPEEITEHFKLKFVIDFIKIEFDPSVIVEKNTSNRNKKIKQLLGATNISAVAGSSPKVRVTIHDPKNIREIIDRLTQLGIFNAVVSEIEVSADFYPRKTADRALIPEVCTILSHGMRMNFGPCRIYDPSARETNRAHMVSNVRNGFENNNTFYSGNRGNDFCRIYPKITDNKELLPEHKHRARYEVNYNLTDSPIPIHKFNIADVIGKRDFSFGQKVSPKNRMQAILMRDAPVMECVPNLGKNVMETGPYSGPKLSNGVKPRRKYAKSTKANLPLNKTIQNQRRTLRKNWSACEVDAASIAPFVTMGARPSHTPQPEAAAQKFTQIQSPVPYEDAFFSITNTEQITSTNTFSPCLPAGNQASNPPTGAQARQRMGEREASCLLGDREQVIASGPDRGELAIARSLSTRSLSHEEQQPTTPTKVKVLENSDFHEDRQEKYFSKDLRDIGQPRPTLVFKEVKLGERLPDDPGQRVPPGWDEWRKKALTAFFFIKSSSNANSVQGEAIRAPQRRFHPPRPPGEDLAGKSAHRAS